MAKRFDVDFNPRDQEFLIFDTEKGGSFYWTLSDFAEHVLNTLDGLSKASPERGV
jgi:hypothetical protein